MKAARFRITDIVGARILIVTGQRRADRAKVSRIVHAWIRSIIHRADGVTWGALSIIVKPNSETHTKMDHDVHRAKTTQQLTPSSASVRLESKQFATQAVPGVYKAGLSPASLTHTGALGEHPSSMSVGSMSVGMELTQGAQAVPSIVAANCRAVGPTQTRSTMSHPSSGATWSASFG